MIPLRRQTNKAMKSSFKNNMEKTGFITLTMTVGEKQLCFLVDTGSNQNSLSTSAFEEVKDFAKEVSRITIYGFEGVPYDQLLVEVPYQCGVMTAKDHFFIMSDSPFNSVEKQCGVRISGLLGYTFLARHKVQIDYESMELTLHD